MKPIEKADMSEAMLLLGESEISAETSESIQGLSILSSFAKVQSLNFNSKMTILRSSDQFLSPHVNSYIK